jgi:hypothetical protein
MIELRRLGLDRASPLILFIGLFGVPRSRFDRSCSGGTDPELSLRPICSLTVTVCG